MGLGLDEVLLEFGCDLVLFEPILEQSGPKGVQGPSTVQTKVIDVVDDSSLSEGDSDSTLAETRPDPISDLSEFGTRSEPVLDLGEAGTEPPPVFKDSVDDSFDMVEDFEKNEGFDTPVVIVQPKTIKIPPNWCGTEEEENQSDEQISRLFVNLQLCKLKPPLLPHNQNLLHPKLLPNHPESPTD